MHGARRLTVYGPSKGEQVEHPLVEELLELGRARVEFKRTPPKLETVEEHCFDCERCSEVVWAEYEKEQGAVERWRAEAENEQEEDEEESD